MIKENILVSKEWELSPRDNEIQKVSKGFVIGH